MKEFNLPVKAITRGPKHHFFSYYDKLQWDGEDKRLLCMETEFMNRSPKPNDVAIVGYAEVDSQEFNTIADTRAWCWQQGSMLQWMPASQDSAIIYNDRIGGRFVSIIVDVKKGRKRTLPRPVYAISNDGTKALSLNFSRNARTRPGYGYVGIRDLYEDQLHPKEDGVFLMDIGTGNHRQIISIDDLAKNKPDETMRGAIHWVNHLLFSPNDSRFIFLHRWCKKIGGKFYTRFYTADTDGSNLHLVDISHASHFIWYDDNHFLVWATSTKLGAGYHFCTDRKSSMKIIGMGQLMRDGHCTFSPDNNWILTDEYPDENGNRPLILYKFPNGPRIDIEYFCTPSKICGHIRCDLHPRWSRNGEMVCIDSVHEDTRQIYVIDVSSIVRHSRFSG